MQRERTRVDRRTRPWMVRPSTACPQAAKQWHVLVRWCYRRNPVPLFWSHRRSSACPNTACPKAAKQWHVFSGAGVPLLRSLRRSSACPNTACPKAAKQWHLIVRWYCRSNPVPLLRGLRRSGALAPEGCQLSPRFEPRSGTGIRGGKGRAKNLGLGLFPNPRVRSPSLATLGCVL